MSTVLSLIDSVLLQLQGEMRIEPSLRATRASDSSLQSVLKACARAHGSIASGDSRVAAASLKAAARLVVDEWALGSDLGSAIVDLAQRVDR